jgi:hypothetical protein
MKHVRATHHIRIAAPIDRCIRFFTPRGEELWVDGWAPRYLHPSDGRTQAGMAFTTGSGDGYTIWLLVDFADHRARYARVTPALRTGFVEVTCRATSASETEVEVTYELTALTAAGEATLDDYAPERYAAMIEGWKALIDAKLPALIDARIA